MEIIKGTVNKRYGFKRVFVDAKISINEGDICLVVGRNGIGKSTLLRILAKVEYFSNANDITHLIDELDISYMPSYLVYYQNMRVLDLLQFYTNTHKHFSIEYAYQYLELFKIDLKSKINQLSDGKRKIVAFTICLSITSKFYVIDEPFPNVDLLNDELFRRMILERYNEHTTFVIATHQINEFEKISNKCLLIKDSKTIETFNTDDIRNETALSVEDYFKEVLRCSM